MVNGASEKPDEVERIALNQEELYLKAVGNFEDRKDTARFYYSLDGENWTAIGNELKMSYTLPHFMGYRYALFNYATEETGGHVDFDFFKIDGK
jgi:beta-xylosidase